jgi:hypothetical protein
MRDDLFKPHKCPICGKFEFDRRFSYDICPYCGWEDDSRDDTDDEESGANANTIGDYRKLYEEGKTETPLLKEYRESVL